jgi:hypothetical protein
MEVTANALTCARGDHDNIVSSRVRGKRDFFLILPAEVFRSNQPIEEPQSQITRTSGAQAR